MGGQVTYDSHGPEASATEFESSKTTIDGLDNDAVDQIKACIWAGEVRDFYMGVINGWFEKMTYLTNILDHMAVALRDGNSVAQDTDNINFDDANFDPS